jgi:aspartate kinase
VCEVSTDVDGVLTIDPRVVPDARKHDTISNEELLEMAASGAKVMMTRSVEVARRYDIPLHIRSSFNNSPGTWVGQEDPKMEQAIISGVAFTLDDAKVTIHGLPDEVGVAARIFSALAKANVNLDVIIQNVSEGGAASISFTTAESDLPKVGQVLEEVRESIGFRTYDTDKDVAKVTLVGAGMKTYPGVAAKMFEVLAANGINIEMISTSTIKISCVIRKQHVETAVKALHEAFELDKSMISREEVFS